MEHGLDERHAKILFPRSRPSQIRAQQTHLLAPLRLHGKFPSPLLPRRGRSRKKFPPPQNARRHVAAIREPPSALRLSMRPPGQKTSLHGPAPPPPPPLPRSPHP